MLIELHIQNYAIIDDLRFEPQKGLNILTGETGAGKSILIGALGLLLGNRANLEQDKKCIIEAVFDIGSYNLQALFEKFDLDYHEKTIIRREINPQDRSRAFINDTPVGLQELRELGEQLVDIHSQHQAQQIGDRDFQYRMMDTVSGTWTLYEDYKKVYKDWQASLRALDELKQKESEINRDAEFKKFQLDELMEAGLNPGEEEQLEEESAMLENAEEILLKAAQGQRLIEGEENSLSEMLAQYLSEIKHINGGAHFDRLRERIGSVLTEMRDLAGELSGLDASVNLDPERLEEVNERLDLLRRLQQKHRVNSVEELIAIREKLDNDLLEIGDLSYEIKELEKKCSTLESYVLELGAELSERRRSGLKDVQERLNNDLVQLGMTNAGFQLELEAGNPPGVYGTDRLSMNFRANKGTPYLPVDKVASGGELSRIMLIIKSYLAEKMTLPTLIFDEIDTGVSGEIALKVADLMKYLSSRHQLITITHLPQIAARGDAHFYIYKEDVDSRTITGIRHLQESDRVQEVARMLSGDNPTEGAMINAKELIAKGNYA